jgi:hypothetical protein
MIKRALSAGQCFEQPASFPSVAASKFGNHHRSCNLADNFLGIPPQDSVISTGETVLGQVTDHFE